VEREKGEKGRGRGGRTGKMESEREGLPLPKNRARSVSGYTWQLK